MTRPLVTGPSTHIPPPFPLCISGTVVKGFGRGSKQLGIPTANLSSSATDALCKDVEVGIYYGWAWLDSERVPREMVMSIGWNPFYKNTVRTAEVHILHEYEHDFYDHELRIIVLGYIRPELDYTTVEALVNDIRIDIQVARNGLERPVYAAFAHHAFFH